MTRRAVAGLAVALLVAGCAGDPPTRRGPKQGVGHGAVEEVMAALAKVRMPCTDPWPESLDGFEQRVSCRIGSDRVTLVHFFGVEQARQFEQSVRGADDHGVFHDLWGAVVPSEKLAKRIAEAIDSTSYA